MRRILLSLSVILALLASLSGCFGVNFYDDIENKISNNSPINLIHKGSLSDYEVEEIAQNILVSSNYCSTFIVGSLGDYKIIDISYDYDEYDRYIVTIDLKASNGDEYENHSVKMYFRYNTTTQNYWWNQTMVFEDEYSIDDFKTAINWGKETTREADENSFDDFTNKLKEQEMLKTLAGTWWDTDSMRCNMTIKKWSDTTYDVEVNWSSIASENTQWIMQIYYDSAKRAFFYTNGIKQNVVYSEDGNESIDIVYNNGSGKIYIKNDHLFWVDDIEGARNGCPFEKSDY